MPLKSRVAWFLQLKELLRFPQHFVAPTRSRFRYQPTTLDEHSVGGLSIIRGTTQPNAEIRSIVATTAPSPSARLTYSIPSSQRRFSEQRRRDWVTGAFHTRPGAMAADVYQRSSWRQILDTRPTGRRSVEAGADRETTPPPRANRIMAVIPAASKQQWLSADPHDKFYRLPSSRQVAFPVRPIGQTRAIVAKSMAPPSGTPSADGIGAAMTPPLSETAGVTTSPQDAAPDRQPAVRNTLHIDGQALGRWTIQYLERALGRPSAGMTGVDPRLSTPRSRISPF